MTTGACTHQIVRPLPGSRSYSRCSCGVTINVYTRDAYAPATWAWLGKVLRVAPGVAPV